MCVRLDMLKKRKRFSMEHRTQRSILIVEDVALNSSLPFISPSGWNVYSRYRRVGRNNRSGAVADHGQHVK